MKYITISEEFALANENYRKDNNYFGFSKTNTGLLVCSGNSYIDFPELWSKKPKMIELTRQDFEPDYNRLEFVVDQQFKLLSKTENYYDKTITIAYMDGEIKKEIIEKMENTSPTKNGYNIDMEQKIHSKETI